MSIYCWRGVCLLNLYLPHIGNQQYSFTLNFKIMIVQFQGETREQAIINHFSLDLEEEEGFFKYIEAMGYSIDSEDEILESLIVMYRNSVHE